MNEPLTLRYDIDGENFTSAGEASVKVKKALRQLGFSQEIIRRVSIAMYEGEINMVIHANGGYAQVSILPDLIEILLCDRGPGIPDVALAMQAGYYTAPEQIRALGFGAGMGLPNMKANTDEMTIHTKVGEGTTIRMIVKTA